MAEKKSGEKLLYCSFCGKSQHEVKKLIAGPSVFICDECIELCNDIVRDEISAENGAKGKRFCLPSSRMMIHQPMGGFQGQASDIEIHAKEILFLKQRLNEMLSRHTGQPIERIERDTDRDNFLSAQEAAEYGLIDQVLVSRETAVAKP